MSYLEICFLIFKHRRHLFLSCLLLDYILSSHFSFLLTWKLFCFSLMVILENLIYIFNFKRSKVSINIFYPHSEQHKNLRTLILPLGFVGCSCQPETVFSWLKLYNLFFILVCVEEPARYIYIYKSFVSDVLYFWSFWLLQTIQRQFAHTQFLFFW